MGISNKSKKSDKETQSPVLKLFKDIMQKEKRDPEKANLLTSKQVEKKKKKHHAASRTKSGHNTVESSHSERYAAPYKGTQELRQAEFDSRTRTIPFQGEKSWVFRGGSDGKKPNSDDTCSCVSCALKKIISTDYACIGCLAVLFTISVLVAVLLVYKSIPCLREKPESEKIFEGERLKRKIDGLSGLRWDQIGKKTFGGKWDEDKVSSYGVPHSMDPGAPGFEDLSSLVDSGSELSKILDSDKISEIQSSERLRDFYKKLIETDVQIRNLKKNDDLLNMENIDDRYKTFSDRAKRSLKIFRPMKMFHFKKNKKDKLINEKANTKKPKNNEETKAPYVAIDSKIKNLKGPRNKRFDNTSEPQGFVIEDKKVVIKFKPNYTNRKSKCSHAPKESKSHENQLKHPFYQNTQRLDELLDKFLNKNMPEIMADQLGLGMIVVNEKNKCKHPKIEFGETPLAKEGKEEEPEKILIENETFMKNMKDEFKHDDTKALKNKNNDFLSIFENEKGLKDNADGLTIILKAETSTIPNDVFVDMELSNGGRKRENSETNNYDLVMSISTMLYDNSLFKKTTNTPNYLMDRVPNVRKLLQTDVDEDQNEVRADDDRDPHDEVDKSSDRRKRKDELSLDDINEKMKMNPASILNPNWKGPMPLYPDELNSMVKPEPIIVNRIDTPVNNAEADEVSKIESPIHSKDSPSETDEFENDLTDMEYIEDYFHNKYNRLVEMAQAYSDYGVLDGRKVVDKKVDDKVKLEGPDHRVKLSLSGLKEGFKNTIFGRPKKDKTSLSEGFRLEVQPTSGEREDNPLDLYRVLQKHIKLSKFKPNPYIHNSYTAAGPEMGLIYAPRKDIKTMKKFEKDNNGVIFSMVKGNFVKSTDNDDKKEFSNSVDEFEKNSDNDLSFNIGKGKRSLKSITEDVKGFSNYFDINDGGEGDYIDDGGAIDAVLNIRNVFDTIRLKFKPEVGAIKDIAMKLATEHILSNNNLKLKREVVDYTPGVSEDSFDTRTVKLATGDEFTANNKFTLEDVTNIGIKLAGRDEGMIDSYTKPALKNELIEVATEKALNNNTGMNISLENVSDFFMMLSNWFSALDGIDINMNHSIVENSSFSPPNNTLPKETTKTLTTELSFPIYDSDMIENIGHRSRVLFSVDANESEVHGKDEGGKEIVNEDTDFKNNITITNIIPKGTNTNKTIVKRNADTSLIFWNDIYDDEYGVAIDHIENNVRDKYSIDKSDFIKVPNKWFRDQVKKIKDGLHKKAESLRAYHKSGNGGISEKGNVAKEKSKIIKSKSKAADHRRISRNTAENPGTAKKTDFAALTANMKKICRKAANDIAKTKKVDVRENTKEGHAAASLMQQLVQLMSDLVDYQVQQRTCRTLPPDLQNFLEWLTSSNPDSPDTDSAQFSSVYRHEEDPTMDLNKMNDHTLDMSSSSEREDRPDARSDCLGTLQAVQDLMRQFEDMNDDDKSKMTGVKEYLESQIFYLQKQMSSVHDVRDFNTDSVRFRRDISENNHKNRTRTLKKIKRRLQQKLSNFMKKFVKKHHKNVTILNNDKKLINNDKKLNNNAFDSVINEKKLNNNEHRQDKDKTNDGVPKAVKEKRNLRDVYYKAIEDAKRITTVKGAHRNDGN